MTSTATASRLPRYLDDEDAHGAEGPVLTHLSPDQGVLELDLRDVRLLPPAELPEVTGWTKRYLVTLLEVLSGQRPTQQLLRWSSADIYSGVQRKAAVQARLRSRTRPAARGAVRAAHVSSLRVSFPGEGVAEVGAVLRDGDRVRAAALRVERCTDRSGDRWRVTALEMR
ncbi:Rv3235 family protein [Kineococcus sp. LSe6-4]|uniref:Rv3235 family protein n=1 Tax=Kineococcus halophytocola TaxID=3234027 RepID=A0ABV4H4B3_9ACTN